MKNAVAHWWISLFVLLLIPPSAIRADEANSGTPGAQAVVGAYRTLLAGLESASTAVTSAQSDSVATRDNRGNLLVRSKWSEQGPTFGMQPAKLFACEAIATVSQSNCISILVHRKAAREDYDKQTARRLSFNKLADGTVTFEGDGDGLSIKLSASNGRSTVKGLSGDFIPLRALCMLNFPEAVPGGSAARRCLMTYVPDLNAKNSIAALKINSDDSESCQSVKSVYNNLLFAIDSLESGSRACKLSPHDAQEPISMTVKTDKKGSKIVECMQSTPVATFNTTQTLFANGDISIESTSTRGLRHQTESYKRGPDNSLSYSVKNTYVPEDQTFRIQSDGQISFSPEKGWRKPFQLIMDAPGQQAAWLCWQNLKTPSAPRRRS